LLAASFVIQANFVLRYPQPELFGDPAAYLRVGRNMVGGVERILGGKDILSVFVAIRGSLYFFAAGALFGLADLIRPQDPTFLRLLLAALNTLGLLGAFFLARGLAGGLESAGLLAVFLGLLHPSLATHLTRAYPDPLTACLFVWASVAFLRGQRTSRPRDFVSAGLLLGAGLLVRPQILGPVLAVVVILSAGAAVLRPSSRRPVLALLSGLLPAALMWIGLNAAIVVTAERRGAEDEFSGRYGWTVFRATYPQGFWQYLETDGWEGPYRLRQEPYYVALEAAARRNPSIMASPASAYAFTLEYVRERSLEYGLLILDNAYRLFDHPVNGYRWDYPISVPWQVRLHHLIVVLALGAVALAGARRPASLPVFLIPGCLGILHGLTFPWPRYSQPAIFILLAAAASFARTLLRPPLIGLVAGRFGAGILALGLGLDLLGSWLFSAFPEPARWAAWTGVGLVLAAPFLAIARAHPRTRQRVAPLLCGALLLALSAAHSIRSVSWHETRLDLGARTRAVEQRIRLSDRAASSLRGAREAFIVFDLLIPDGDVSGLVIDVNRRRYPGSMLVPTMPRLPESTSTGSRDPRTYRQWWALPLAKDALGETGDAEVRVRLETPPSRRPITIFGDRYEDQASVYEGPSFGDWPTTVALKLEYDGDYRIPFRRKLESRGTESLLGDDAGAMRAVPGVHRIRILTLASDQGFTSFAGDAPVRASAPIAMGFLASSGSRGEAWLRPYGASEAFRLRLGERNAVDEGSGPWRLCYRPLGDRGGSPYGGFVLSVGRWTGADPPRFDVSFLSGMSIEPMFFSANPRPRPEELRALFDSCNVPPGVERLHGASRIIDGSRNSYPDDTGKWKVASLF